MYVDPCAKYVLTCHIWYEFDQNRIIGLELKPDIQTLYNK